MTDAARAVEVHDLAVRYGPRSDSYALEPTSFAISSGQWVSLLGPNGSGKSTMLRCLATLSRPTSGSVATFGIDPFSSKRHLHEVRARLGVVFQAPALDSLLTVRENLRLVAACFRLDRTESRIEAAAEAMGLTDRLNQRVGKLSGGLMRRADLARALLPEPELLLLDEPTTGLDLEARLRFLEVIREQHDQRGLTVVFATHQMDEAEASQRVIMMALGRVIADDDPGALRATLSGPSLRVEEPLPEDVVRRLGEARPDGSFALPEECSSVLSELATSGRSFRVGPATLADVYLARTGQALEAAS